MEKPKITTLKELKKNNYQPNNIQEELAKNLREKIKKGETTFEGLIGYENTVIPEVERAILSGHNINLLGLRGQAKTRLARQMTELLDEWIPVVDGSEINDDPLQPISRWAKEIIEEKGDNTLVSWIHRDERFFEKTVAFNYFFNGHENKLTAEVSRVSLDQFDTEVGDETIYSLQWDVSF
mgnify:CR=1 FL=1